MSHISDSTVRMANQIALNFQAIGQKAAITATADHIAHFWDPRMKAAAMALLDDEASGLSHEAREALRLLAQAGAPPSQTRATEFNHADQSDAG